MLQQKQNLMNEFKTEVHNGVYYVREPGRFEGHCLWAAWYYMLSANGASDGEIDLCDYSDIPEEERDLADSGPWASYFTLDEGDWELWPELRGTKYVGVYTDDYGFVHVIDSDAVERLLAEDAA